MSVDERLARSQERCSLHPGSPAVATCDGCGRPMCLSCAVPVRGMAYGAECLGTVLGEDQPADADASRRPRRRHVAAGFAIALAATVLPWTTFGEGSTAPGAWSRSPRWAMVAAVAALLGVALSVVRGRRGRAERSWDVASIGLGAIVVAGAALEWFRPPFPSRPSIVPWIAAAGGLFAAASALRCLREETRVAP